MTRAPAISLYSEKFKKIVTLMVDTGLELNLLKADIPSNGAEIDGSHIITISGITDNHVYTQGSVLVNLFGKPVSFHLVNRTFPIEQDGILESEFLKKTGTSVKYTKECVQLPSDDIPFVNKELIHVPVRSSTIFRCRVENNEASEGYIPRLHTITGMYMGDALVRNE